MTVNIDWGLANGAPDPGAMVQQGFELGQKQRDQTALRRALGLLTNDPGNAEARSTVGALDPQLLAATDTMNWQRQAHTRADTFDAAYADYMRGGMAAPATATPAAAPLPPVTIPAASAPATPPAMHDGSEYGRVDVMGATPPNGVAAAPSAAAPSLPAVTALLGGAGPAAPAMPAAPVDVPAAPAPAPAALSGREEAFARMLAADPAKAALVRQQEAQQRLTQLDTLDKIAEHATRLLGRAVDQSSYEAAGAAYNAELQRNGLPPQPLPATYSPQVVAALQRSVLDTKAQIETARQEATLAETARHNRADEDKTKYAPIKVKNSSGGEDIYIYDQATGQMVNSGSGGSGGSGGGGGGTAKGGFDAAIAFILPHEGGYAPSDGNGKPVNFGINQGANPGVDVKNLTRDGAVQIYRDKYWAQSGAEKLPENAQTAFFDTYIINPERAKALWQRSGGDVNKFLDLRDGWLNGLIAENPGKYGRFKKAWTNRTNDLRTLVGSDGEDGGGAPAGAPGPGKPLIHTEGPPNGGLSAEEINFYAQDVANGGDMPQLGMGKDAAMARQAILKQAAKIGMGQGRDGTDFGVRRAEVKAVKTGLQALERQAGPVLAFERTAQRNGALALSLADKVGNTGVPIFNKWMNAGRQAVAGDSDVSAFHAAVETFANEFAKLTSTATGGGVTSDAARAHVYAMVNRDQSPAQFKATMQVLYQDMANRRQGIADQRNELLGRLQAHNKPAASSSAPGADYPTLTPEQVHTAPAGTVFRTTDGRTMRKR